MAIVGEFLVILKCDKISAKILKIKKHGFAYVRMKTPRVENFAKLYPARKWKIATLAYFHDFGENL